MYAKLNLLESNHLTPYASYCCKPQWESNYTTCGLHAPDHTQSMASCQTHKKMFSFVEIKTRRTCSLVSLITKFKFRDTYMNLLMIVFVGRYEEWAKSAYCVRAYWLWPFISAWVQSIQFLSLPPIRPPSILPSYSPLGYARVPKDSQQSRWNPLPLSPKQGWGSERAQAVIGQTLQFVKCGLGEILWPP